MTHRPQRHLGTHAVVLGGSIAGLVCARVLSDHFDKVTIIERDPRPEGPDARKGAPQMRHAHLLLNAASAILEDLFAGITNELTQAGATLINCGSEVVMHHYGMWKPRFQGTFHIVGCSRPFLEWHIRRRTEALANVEIRHGCSAESLQTSHDRSTVTGVVIKSGENESTLNADLVVDATGRGTRAPRWLEALGYTRPIEQEVRVDLGYTSRLYERPATVPGAWKALAIYSRPYGQRGAFIFEVEHERWTVSLPGYFKDHCPTDDEGFLEFAKSLPSPVVYDAIRNAKPLTDPVMHKIPSSRWFRYDKLKRFPERFLAIGDSVVSLNPVYGQGMLVAVQGIHEIGALLDQRARDGQGLAGLSQVVQKKIAAAVLPAWLLSTTMDLQHPKALGERPFGLSAAQRIFADLIDATSLDAEACRVFYDILHMRRGFEALLDPKLLVPLLEYSVKRPFVPLEQRLRPGPMPPAVTA